MNFYVLILYITLVCVSAGPSRSQALKHEDAEGLDKVEKLEMREAAEANDANNRLKTPTLKSGVSALEVEVPLMKKAINRLQFDLSSSSSDHPNPSGSSDKSISAQEEKNLPDDGKLDRLRKLASLGRRLDGHRATDTCEKKIYEACTNGQCCKGQDCWWGWTGKGYCWDVRK